MILLGIIVLLVGAAAGALTYLATADRAGSVAVEAFGFTRDATALELAAYGLVTGLVFCLGWALLAAGVRKRARVRRDERQRAHVEQIERRAADERTESERRFEEAGRRDEDFRRRDDDLGRREKEVSVRHDHLYDREQQLSRREQDLTHHQEEFDAQRRPSVADVVTGRAKGSVHDGTAEWVGPEPVPTLAAETREIDPGSAAPDAVTEELPRVSDDRQA